MGKTCGEAYSDTSKKPLSHRDFLNCQEDGAPGRTRTNNLRFTNKFIWPHYPPAFTNPIFTRLFFSQVAPISPAFSPTVDSWWTRGDLKTVGEGGCARAWAARSGAGGLPQVGSGLLPLYGRLMGPWGHRAWLPWLKAEFGWSNISQPLKISCRLPTYSQALGIWECCNSRRRRSTCWRRQEPGPG